MYKVIQGNLVQHRIVLSQEPVHICFVSGMNTTELTASL